MFYKSSYITRSVPNDRNQIFLTFDDGPDPLCTPDVLELLKRHQITATFFLVANRASNNQELVHEIVNAGHSIGNHSLDHRYSRFFACSKKIVRWIEESETVLNAIIKRPTVGFRSPAGVVTPSLVRALQSLHMPLIHWNVRFYDTNFHFTKKRALKACRTLSAGSIILLHDTQRSPNKEIFLESLDLFISEAKRSGFYFAAMTSL